MRFQCGRGYLDKKNCISMEEIHFLFIMSYSVILQANPVDVCVGPDEAEA